MLRLGELTAFLRADNSHFDRGIEASQRRIRELAREFDRTGNGNLLGGLDRERARLNQLERAAGELGAGGLATARSALNNVGTVATNVFSNLWNLIPVMTGLAGAAALTVPAIGLLGGALGSLPALSVGLGAGVGALILGFAGLSDQFKKTAGAGGSVVDKAWQIASAERRVRDANLEVLAATQALTRARETAAERIDDLNRSITGAHLDEEAAVMAVADAQKELEQARRSGTADDVKKADLALRQQRQTLDDIRERLGDLTEEQQRNAQQGVEGSDEVRAALDRQRKSVEGVADAEHALAEARKPAGGGGGAAADIMAIAPAAAAAVAAIKALKPAWDDLRLDVQQRLFAGVAGEIRSLSDAWLPTLKSKLGNTADSFNGLFKIFSGEVKKPEFIDNIGKGLDSVDRLIDKVGGAVAGPFVDAFGRLSEAAAPFLDAVGDEVAGLVTDFANWIKSADESGALKDFFTKAGDFFHDVMDMGKDVGAIIGDIMSALFNDPANANGGSTWEKLKKTLDELRQWFDDPENQERIQQWFGILEKFGEWFLWVAEKVGQAKLVYDDFQNAITNWTIGIGKSIEGFVDGAGAQYDRLVGWVSGLPARIGKAAAGMWDGVTSSFRSALNWIIGRWNNLSLTIGGGTILGQRVPSMTLNTPDIPYLAGGGIVRATPGGRLAVVGEGGKDEAVIPLNKLDGMMRGGQQITVKFDADDSAIMAMLFRNIRYTVVGEYGGSVEAALAGAGA